MELTDPNESINWVRQQRGRAPLPNPHVIDGFGGPNDAPTPSLIPASMTPDPFGLDLEGEAPAVPPAPVSPLIPVVRPEQPALPKLVVQDAQAFFDGKAVALEPRDVNAIVKIILLAVERSVRVQLRAVQAQIPKREYKRGASGAPKVAQTKPRNRPRRVARGSSRVPPA